MGSARIRRLPPKGGLKLDIDELSTSWARRNHFKSDMDRFLELYRSTECNLCKASRRARITTQLVKAWRDDLPWFKEAMEEAETEVFGDARSLVFSKARKNVGGARWLLMSHQKGRDFGFGQRFSLEEKRELTLTMRLQVDQMKQMYSRTELEQLYSLLSKATNQLGEERDNGPADSAGGDGAGGDVSGTLH